MWRDFRADGWPIISTWIDEDAEGATDDFSYLWSRIAREVAGSAGLILYAEPQDMPLKGALIEAGMAIGSGVPVFAVLPGVVLEPRSMRPVGSWLLHPSVQIVDRVETALICIMQARDGCTIPVIPSAHGDYEAIVTTPDGAASAVGATWAEARERGLAMVREARGHGG